MLREEGRDRVEGLGAGDGELGPSQERGGAHGFEVELDAVGRLRLFCFYCLWRGLCCHAAFWMSSGAKSMRFSVLAIDVIPLGCQPACCAPLTLVCAALRLKIDATIKPVQYTGFSVGDVDVSPACRRSTALSALGTLPLTLSFNTKRRKVSWWPSADVKLRHRRCSIVTLLRRLLALRQPPRHDMESWEQLRAQARTIEGDVERALPQLASLAADGDSGAEAQRLLKTVQDHLKALERVRDSLQAEEAREPAPARRALVERCRAVHVDYASDVARVAKEIRKNADRAKLFSGADDVIDLEGGPDHLKGVHKERKHTTNALRGVGDVIEQAHDARTDLAAQRETLEGSTTTAQSMSDRLPTIGGIIQKMRQKKYRENAVVGVTVGCCASFLLWAVLT